MPGSDSFPISLAATNKVTPPEPDPTGLFPGKDYKIEYKIDATHDETEDVNITFPLNDVPGNMDNPRITQFVYREKDNSGAQWTRAESPDPNGPAVPFTISSTNPFTVEDHHNDLKDYKFLLYVDYNSGAPDGPVKTFIVDPEIHNREE